MLVSLDTKINELKEIRKKGRLKPVKLGFECFNDNNSLIFSKGVPVYIGGEPHHGKSTMTKELAMHLMQNHDFKIFGYFGEDIITGVQDIITEFAEVFTGLKYSEIQPNGQKENYAMTDEYIDLAHAFLLDKLYICEVKKDEKFTLDYFYNDIAEAEKQGIKFDCAILDPIYDIDGFEADAKMMNRILNRFNKECHNSGRVDILVNHVAEAYTIFDKERREYIRKPARNDQWYGGKNNARRAYLQLLVFRPTPISEPLEHEEKIEENETWVIVQKAKPKGIGRLGRIKLFFDWKKNRYYEETPVGKRYAMGSNLGEVEEPKIDIKDIKPSLSDAFGEVEEINKDNENGFPF